MKAMTEPEEISAQVEYTGTIVCVCRVRFPWVTMVMQYAPFNETEIKEVKRIVGVFTLRYEF